ncbi:molybdate ABC transporter substrate-binding protein [Gloeobacter violaceus]|uniref:ABC transporter ATP-binding protein n=1 Tax=Gloeobacter violaceus (strain ATCC 29082 / PCC 7421) TaxID=251221 RepID=Q7NDF2_GLOVI|nr:molybdate ABC transporter substrate-binding protein [Gloeobacter violaceus]BAC92224.1 ABC transporter ATP-binding protein [Gloeobacter violaceus PCC 7421]
MHFRLLVGFVSLALACWGLGAAAQAAELTVSAAISLKEAFGEIAVQFEKGRPGDKINFNFAASGELSQQIERGAPVDVFASAALKQMNDLDKKGLLLAGTNQPFARNRLVVVVPKGQTKVASFEQLSKVGRLTIGNPKTVPAGQYAAEALTKAGIYDTLLASQKIVFSENVRQALAYVEDGNVDAGIVYVTDARASQKADVGFLVPANYSEPVVYPIAVVKDSKQPDPARAFVTFVLSARGQEILLSKGFLGANK